MKNKNRLGRGIDALFSESLQDDSPHIIELSLDEIFPNPIQPRKEISQDKISELSESIKQHGIISPIIVRRVNAKYEIVAGERRYHACRQAGLKMIPSIVKEIPDDEAFKISLIENVQREDLNPMEEAEAYHTLKNQFLLTHQDIAYAVSKDRSTITNSLRLVGLPEEIKQSLRDGFITTGHARAILMLDNTNEQLTLLERIIKRGLSVRDTERVASSKKEKALKKKNGQQILDDVSYLLSERLSAKVMCSWGKRKGKIVIEVSSRDDLNRIVNDISRSEMPI